MCKIPSIVVYIKETCYIRDFNQFAADDKKNGLILLYRDQMIAEYNKKMELKLQLFAVFMAD